MDRKSIKELILVVVGIIIAAVVITIAIVGNKASSKYQKKQDELFEQIDHFIITNKDLYEDGGSVFAGGTMRPKVYVTAYTESGKQLKSGWTKCVTTFEFENLTVGTKYKLSFNRRLVWCFFN